MSAFPLLERRARAKLDYWTMNRITDVDGDIQLCMTLIVNALDNVQKSSQQSSMDGCPMRTRQSGRRVTTCCKCCLL